MPYLRCLPCFNWQPHKLFLPWTFLLDIEMKDHLLLRKLRIWLNWGLNFILTTSSCLESKGVCQKPCTTALASHIWRRQTSCRKHWDWSPVFITLVYQLNSYRLRVLNVLLICYPHACTWNNSLKMNETKAKHTDVRERSTAVTTALLILKPDTF